MSTVIPSVKGDKGVVLLYLVVQDSEIFTMYLLPTAIHETTLFFVCVAWALEFSQRLTLYVS